MTRRVKDRLVNVVVAALLVLVAVPPIVLADGLWGGSAGGGGVTPVSRGGTGETTEAAAFDALAPTTTQGDIIYFNGTTNTRLPKGTGLQHLRMNAGATAPEWATASSGGATGFVELPDTITSNSSVPVSLTGLSWSVASGSTYRFSCQLRAGSGLTTTGVQVGIDVPAGSSVAWSCSHVNSATTGNVWAVGLTDDGECALSEAPHASAPFHYQVNGHFTAGNTGTAIMRVNSESTGTTVAIYAGSTCALILEP